VLPDRDLNPGRPVHLQPSKANAATRTIHGPFIVGCYFGDVRQVLARKFPLREYCRMVFGFFCSCDVNLDRMTFMNFQLDPYSIEIYIADVQIKYELPTARLSKVIVWTDIIIIIIETNRQNGPKL